MIFASSEQGAFSPPRGGVACDALVDALRAGSPDAFAEMVRLFQPRIYRVGYRFTRSHHDAEDIVQETFLRAYRAAPRFRGNATLGTWLHAIAANFARNQYRYWKHRKRHLTVSLDAKTGDDDKRTVCDTLIVEEPTAFTHSDQQVVAAQIETAIGRLAERDRQILIRRVTGRASYAELAREFDIAVGTVKSRLSRARERLRERLDRESDPVVGCCFPHSQQAPQPPEKSNASKAINASFRGVKK